MFGGNSNWRGPIWFPVNFLLIEALERYHHFYGDELKVECPTGSGHLMTLQQVARELARRLGRIFLPRREARRPLSRRRRRAVREMDPHWRTCCCSTSTSTATPALGSAPSHQTGWTSLVGPCTL
jgi:hypothetical protein